VYKFFLWRYKLKASSRSKGFSLIEMLIALIILSISLLGLAGLMVTTTKNNSFGSHMTEGATFAQDKLEELRTTQWALIVPNTATTDQKTGSTGIVYTRSWLAVPNNPAPDDTLKAITITVSWNDGINRSIRLLSAISN
jgi:type IV pilus assembly protein PilV